MFPSPPDILTTPTKRFFKILSLHCSIRWMDEYLSLHMTGTYSHRAVKLVLSVLQFPSKPAKTVPTAEGKREDLC